MSDIDVIAAGEHPRAPTVPEIRRWAKDHGVVVKSVPVPTKDGFAAQHSAELDGCGGVYSEPDGALHLLYHGWRNDHPEENS